LHTTSPKDGGLSIIVLGLDVCPMIKKEGRRDVRKATVTDRHQRGVLNVFRGVEIGPTRETRRSTTRG